MAARAYSYDEGAIPAHEDPVVQGYYQQGEPRMDLKNAALRNSYGAQYASQHFALEAKPAPIAVEAVDKFVEQLPFLPPRIIAEASPVIATSAIDVADLPPTARAKALEWQRRQQAMVTTTNWRLSSNSIVMAWNILPAQLFQGELGRFLIMACDFHAHGPANTMLLPTMHAGSEKLGLPQHPLTVSDRHFNNAMQRVSALRDRVAAEHRRANIALQNGDLSQIYARTDSKARYCKELAKIVDDIATAELSADAVKSHRVQFGPYIAAL